MRLKVFISGILFLVSFTCFSQNRPGPAFVSLEYLQGKQIIKTNPKYLNDRVRGFDMSVGYSYKNRNDYWITYLNCKAIVYTLVYIDQSELDGLLDTSAHAFGYHIAFTPSLYIQLYGSKWSSLYLVPGMGIGYNNKTFYTDERNIFIGSKINYAQRIELLHELRISEKLKFTTGLRFFHYSNSAIQLPNRGLNQLHLKAGLAYQIN